MRRHCAHDIDRTNNLATSNQVKALANQSVLSIRQYPTVKADARVSVHADQRIEHLRAAAGFFSIVPDTMWVQENATAGWISHGPDRIGRI